MIRVRRAIPDESHALTSLCRRAKAALGYPEEWLKEWEPQLLISEEDIRTSNIFVAEQQGAAVGVMALVPGPPAEIDHLWVEPDAQSKGVGTKLVSHAVLVSREQGWEKLRVVADPSALQFYEKMGFSAIGTLDAPVFGSPRQLPVLVRRINEWI